MRNVVDNKSNQPEITWIQWWEGSGYLSRVSTVTTNKNWTFPISSSQTHSRFTSPPSTPSTSVLIFNESTFQTPSLGQDTGLHNMLRDLPSSSPDQNIYINKSDHHPGFSVTKTSMKTDVCLIHVANSNDNKPTIKVVQEDKIRISIINL